MPGKTMFRLTKSTRAIGLLFGVLLAGSSEAILDYTGDGVSEVWKIENPGMVADENDGDGDGVSNHEELIAGTDPGDPGDYLALEIGSQGPGKPALFQWMSVAGKVYTIERFDPGSGAWEKVLNIFPETISRPRQVPVPLPTTRGLFRLSVKDIDVDNDGLNAWEEARFGTSDLDPMSGARSEGGGRTDYVKVLEMLQSPEGVTLTSGVTLPRNLPGEAAAARFLIKASFGPTRGSIADLVDQGFVGWIDQQWAISKTKSAAVLAANGYEGLSDAWRYSWWRLVNRSPDQLRQRLAYALSQILVVNYEGGTVLGTHPPLQAHYYDFFINHSDQTYRELLEEVTYSPVMGWYLSHLRNRKADPDINRFPDENFAREIMQLFSIGLWELNEDGTQKLDEFGDLIATYGNEEITEVARVFTGMSFSTTNAGEDPTTWFFNAGVPPVDWQNPLRFFPEEHDQEEKTIVSGMVIPAGQEGAKDVEMTLDTLCQHPSCAPFLSKLLIQRFTSSNPSPAYVSRVVTVWKETGGRLDRVLEAILLDPEVLFTPRDDASGKLREPIIRLAHFSRAFGFSPPDPESWALEYHGLNRVFGQYGMLSPSVFNFYLPDFSPQGELRDRRLLSPESEISTFTNLIGMNNFYLNALERGYNNITGDYSDLEILEPDTNELLDDLDLLLTGGTMTPANRIRITEAVDQMYTPTRRIEAAIHLITQTPGFAVAK